MTPKVAEAKYAGDYRIWFRFADGVEGEVDLESELWGEMFQPLKDKTLFARFQLYPERSTIFWPRAGVPLRENAGEQSQPVGSGVAWRIRES